LARSATGGDGGPAATGGGGRATLARSATRGEGGPALAGSVTGGDRGTVVTGRDGGPALMRSVTSGDGGPAPARTVMGDGVPALVTGGDGGAGPAPSGPVRPVVARAGRGAEPEPVARRPLSVVPEAPRVSRSAVERLAEVTGGAVEGGEGALRTLHFPAPGRAGGVTADLTQAPYTVTRAIDEAPAAAPAPAPAAAAPAPQPEQQPQQGGMDLEAAYEYFLDRFKRDLLIEREQSGHLLIDNP
jgi:hypothetical protein